MPDPRHPQRICLACHLGHLRRQAITHVEWHEGQLIVVPHVHAEVCDFCGATSLADDQLWRLDQLLRHGNDLQASPGRSSRRSTVM